MFLNSLLNSHQITFFLVEVKLWHLNFATPQLLNKRRGSMTNKLPPIHIHGSSNGIQDFNIRWIHIERSNLRVNFPANLYFTSHQSSIEKSIKHNMFLTLTPHKTTIQLL